MTKQEIEMNTFMDSLLKVITERVEEDNPLEAMLYQVQLIDGELKCAMDNDKSIEELYRDQLPHIVKLKQLIKEEKKKHEK